MFVLTVDDVLLLNFGLLLLFAYYYGLGLGCLTGVLGLGLQFH